MTSPINHVRCNAYIYIAYIYRVYISRIHILSTDSTVLSAKATDTFGSLLGRSRSQKSSAVRLKKVTTSSSNQADSHVVPLCCILFVKLVMRFIFTYMNIFRPTDQLFF